MNKRISYIQSMILRFGIQNTAKYLAIRTLNNFGVFKTYAFWSLDTNNAQLEHPSFSSKSHEIRELFQSDLHEISTTSVYDIDEDFIRSALNKGDQCFGLFSGNTLASYVFFSCSATAIDDEYQVLFPEKTLYIYKVFTHPRFRGLGYAKQVIARGVEITNKNNDLKSFFALIEITNFSSELIFRNLGFKRTKKLSIIGLKGRSTYPLFWPKSSMEPKCRLEKLSNQLL